MADTKLLSFYKNGSRLLEFYFRFRFWPMCRHRHVIWHLLAKFCSNQTIGGLIMTSYHFFKMAAIELEIYFWVRFSDGTCSGRWKSTWLPDFDEISHNPWL